MGLAVDAADAAVGIDDGNGVIERRSGTLIEAHRNDNAQLRSQRLHLTHCRILRRRGRQRIGLVPAFLTEIAVLEQLRQQDDLRTVRRRTAHHFRRSPAVLFGVCGARHLHRCNCYFTHEKRSFLLRESAG